MQGNEMGDYGGGVKEAERGTVEKDGLENIG